jgi:hypothetical protein
MVRLNPCISSIDPNEGGQSKECWQYFTLCTAATYQQPGQLTMDELKDGQQFAHICKAETQQQAKGLRKVHLRN